MTAKTLDARLLVLCTVRAGLDSLSAVLQQGANVVCVVGVAEPKKEARDSISGWADIRSYALQHSIPFIEVQDYTLRATDEREKFSSLDFDLIWVAGWQRLVPPWLMSLAKWGAIGAHGSPDGIEKGRGRSPQNWAILMGADTFAVSIFRLTPAVDDGAVIATQTIPLNPWDNIATSYKKVALAVADLVIGVVREPDLLTHATNQEGPFFYYPKRIPSDGMVDWSMTQREIWAHCNALRHPYPGLRTQVEKGGLIKIWSCQPFKSEQTSSAIGRIEFVFQDGSFLVACGDGQLLVTKYESEALSWIPQVGCLLTGRPFAETLDEILQRHESLEQHQPLSPRIRALWAHYCPSLDESSEAVGQENDH